VRFALAAALLALLPACSFTNTAAEARLYPSERAERVFLAARAVGSEQRRWTEVHADAATGKLGWEARSLLWGFVDDVAVVVTSDPAGGTRVDASSASRVGKSDFGVNARRLESYLEQVDAKLAAQ
jgi:hypothetical protein